MLLNEETTNQLKAIFGKLGLKYKDSELDSIALSIARFVYAKEIVQGHDLNNLVKETDNE
jgi:hypothetical protein